MVTRKYPMPAPREPKDPWEVRTPKYWTYRLRWYVADKELLDVLRIHYGIHPPSTTPNRTSPHTPTS